MKTARPPRWAEALVARTLERQDQEFALGDLAEEHTERRQRTGRVLADGWYGAHAVSAVLRSIFGGGGSRGNTPGDPARNDQSGNLFAEAVHDVRHCVRGLVKAPGFTAAAIITLALGIGATTAVFSFANGVLFRTVPGVTKSEDLALVHACRPYPQPTSCSGGQIRYSDLRDIETRAQFVSGLAAYQGAGEVEVAAGETASHSLRPLYVTASYFDALGVIPAVGRAFTEEEDQPSEGAPVAVISHRLWRAFFNSSPHVVGRELLINGHRITVVGVAPEGFRGVDFVPRDDLWLPASAIDWINRFGEDDSGRRFRYLVARRNPGASWEQVKTELDSFGSWLAEQYPVERAGLEDIFFRVSPVGTTAPQMVAIFFALFAVVGLITLVACSNVAGLLLIKSLRRRGEIAVRKALGASRGRIVRQHLTESTVLWLIGGAAAAFLCYGIMRVAEWQAPMSDLELRVDFYVMTFIGCLSLVVGLAFGALPALGAARVDAARWIGQAAPMATGKRRWIRSLLSAAQLGGTLTLLVGTLLMARTVNTLSGIDLGYDPADVTVFRVTLGEARFDGSTRVQYYREMSDRLRAAGVEEVAMGMLAPVGGSRGVNARMRLVDGDPDETREVLATRVSPSYFDVLRIPVVRGRTFTEEEVLGSVPSPLVVLSQSVADGWFGDDDPLGKLVEFPRGDDPGREYRVVGIVGDIRVITRPESITEGFARMAYWPVGDDGSIPLGATFLVRASPGASDTGRLIRSTASALDADLPVREMRQMSEDLVPRLYGPSLIMASSTGAMSVLGLILAAVGLYGIIGMFASERMVEFGIRSALGAGHADILRLVAFETIGVVLPGVLIGLLGSFALGVILEGYLYGVSPLDPLSWVLAVIALAGAVTVATVLPARRAMRVDPVAALQST